MTRMQRMRSRSAGSATTARLIPSAAFEIPERTAQHHGSGLVTGEQLVASSEGVDRILEAMLDERGRAGGELLPVLAIALALRRRARAYGRGNDDHARRRGGGRAARRFGFWLDRRNHLERGRSLQGLERVQARPRSFGLCAGSPKLRGREIGRG